MNKLSKQLEKLFLQRHRNRMQSTRTSDDLAKGANINELSEANAIVWMTRALAFLPLGVVYFLLSKWGIDHIHDWVPLTIFLLVAASIYTETALWVYKKMMGHALQWEADLVRKEWTGLKRSLRQLGLDWRVLSKMPAVMVVEAIRGASPRSSRDEHFDRRRGIVLRTLGVE